MIKKVLILGCTGSIGTSTLSIIREFSHQFIVCGLTAHSNNGELRKLAKEFNCKAFLTSTDDNLEDFIKNSQADICVNGISGSAGLMPSFFCATHGIDLALANKETIVMASHIIQKIALKNNCRILPVDSEHSAIFSMVERFTRENVQSITITASGGPFRKATIDELQEVTPEQALKHPTWEMGKKISIDSATLANKGLEVIEACKLFNISPDKVQVTIHPQSLVHSFITTNDGDIYAQISNPDMRRPILSALAYPRILENSLQKFDFTQNIDMSFSPPNNEYFPLLSLAFESQRKGGSYTIAYNAANEVAVDLFLNEKIRFLGIPALVQLTLDEDWSMETNSIQEVFEIDAMARKKAHEYYCSTQFESKRHKTGGIQ